MRNWINRFVCLAALLGSNVFYAHANTHFKSESIYLAVSLMNDYKQKMLYDTDNDDDFICTDVEFAKEKGVVERCKKLAQIMVENNIVSLGKQVREDLKQCNDRVKQQQRDLDFFENTNRDMSDYIEIAGVINNDEHVFFEIDYYLTVAKVESGDQVEIDDINNWMDMNLSNAYIDEKMRIKDVNSLNCLNLQVTKFTRRESDAEEYERYVTKTCKTVERLQQCHHELYTTTQKLRTVVDELVDNYGVAYERDYLYLPRVKAVGQK